MSAKHTPEPWASDCFLIVSKARPGGMYGGQPVCHTGGQGLSGEESEANATRIVECVNALAGLDPAAVPKLVAALEGALRIESLWLPTSESNLHKYQHELNALAAMKESFVAALAQVRLKGGE